MTRDVSFDDLTRVEQRLKSCVALCSAHGLRKSGYPLALINVVAEDDDDDDDDKNDEDGGRKSHSSSQRTTSVSPRVDIVDINHLTGDAYVLEDKMEAEIYEVCTQNKKKLFRFREIG